MANMGATLPGTATDYPNMILLGGALLFAGLAVLGWLWWRDRY